MNPKLILLLSVCMAIGANVQAKDPANQINLSAFMLANLMEDSPNYGHVEVARRLNDQLSLGVEFITWQYGAPLGIPYWDSFEDPAEDYPGRVTGIGLGLTSQWFWSDRWFAKMHITPLRQTYFDTNGEDIQTGFQLFTAARLGGRWRLFHDALFIEPSLAVTAWPINTNLPDDFQAAEDRWPNYFLFEPGLNIGYTF